MEVRDNMSNRPVQNVDPPRAKKKTRTRCARKACVTNDYQLIFDNTSDALICLDSEGRVICANSAAERLFRIKSSEMTGEGFWDAFPQARTAAGESALNDALAGLRPLRFDLFFPLRYIWVSILAVPSGDGAILFLRDISDRARLMQTEAVQEGVRAILEIAPVAISITRGSEHRTEIINRKARELIGSRDIVGIPARTAFPDLEGQGLFELLDRVYHDGTPFEGKEVMVKYLVGGSSEMREGWFDISYQPLRDTSGAISGILSVSVDVTEQVVARRRLEDSLGG